MITEQNQPAGQVYVVEGCTDAAIQSVLLINTIAPYTEGIDLSGHHVGSVVPVSRAVADVLVREGWAILVRMPHVSAPSGIITDPTRHEPF